MPLFNLPATPDAFADATWPEIVPYFDELAQCPLAPDNVEAWLQDWSLLESLLSEAASLALIAYTTDTADPVKEAAHIRFASMILPQMQEQHVRLGKRLLDLGYQADPIQTMVRSLRNQIDIFREANVPLLAETQKLNARYQKITGSMIVEWEGEQKTIPQLQPFLLVADRGARERAFRLQTRPYVEQRSALADLFDEMYAIRMQVAQNAGFDNYRDYVFREKDRFDYTPADCEQLHAAVEATFVPAVRRLYEQRREQMGLAALRPWDVDVDPHGRQPLQPFQAVDTLVEGAARIFQKVDPALGTYFGTLSREHLLDLESRFGKAPGGYCRGLAHRKRPFIFMNAVGLAGDVQTLLHESGHAFHIFEAAPLPLLWQRHYGMEMAEVASMSMELLAAPYLDKAHGGLYDPEDYRRARVQHLEAILLLMPHMAAVDAFQHWIYTDPAGADRDARDAAWLRIRSRFEQGIDWSGLDAERVARWYRQLHIFQYPFYYVEYGIAQLGALQIWRNSLEDQAGALAGYRRALALGGTRPLPELYAAAGAQLLFDAGSLSDLVDLIETEKSRLKS